MKTVLVVFGTRPEAIKMCPLVNAIKRNPELRGIVCVTGQHRQMLDQVLEAFSVEPDYDLSIMRDRQTLYDITADVLLKMRDVLIETKPDIVLVHGDTTTSFAAALAAFYEQVPIGHVEAGLRTHNLYSPFPEEFNRQAVDVLCDYFFAPTETAKSNLLSEGKPAAKIYVTGNTGIDALATTVRAEYAHPELEWAADSRLILVTAHRRENLGEPMRNMFRAIKRIVEQFEDVKIIYPVHLNPAVRSVASDILGNDERIHLIDPLEVIDFHNFLARSYMVFTDSGGIQEEAPSLGKPVLVMRDTTERPEGVEAGTLKLVGTSEEGLFLQAEKLLTSQEDYDRMSHASNPYGDGYASERIVRALLDD